MSYEATREKLLRKRDYHISMLHLWWARRPLAAARAAVYAALVPAPDDIDSDRQSRFFEALCAWGGPESTIREARKQVLEANGGVPPKVLDMFAGGGAIPLEASRLGCESTAVELNPVAHIIELCTLAYPQRFGQTLADDVREWGAWLIARAEEEIGDLYPAFDAEDHQQGTLNNEQAMGLQTPVAYLWTRSVPCPNAAIGEHRVPLVRQTWLVKKSGLAVALKPVPDRTNLTISWEVVQAAALTGLGFEPEKAASGGGASCLICGAAVGAEYAREAGRAGRYETELLAVGLTRPSVTGKTYLGSAIGAQLVPDTDRVDAVIRDAAADGVEPPDEPIPPTGNAGLATGKVYLYGMSVFEDVFTRRQLAMLLTLCRLTPEAHGEMLRREVDPSRAKAIATYLGLLVDRMADYHSTFCTWHTTNEGISSTYSRQALQMTWDFVEANPFGGAGGDLVRHLEGIAKVVEHCAAAGNPASVIRGSATELPLDDSSFDAVITDPPYYDNISYADVSDFFYVWLKRSVGHLYPEHLTSALTPKRAEAIAAAYRHEGKDAARDAYEAMMAQSFAEAHRVLKPDGVFVCVYAHQTTAGWSTLIEAVRRAGFTVVEAWPLDTEMPVRGVAQGTASLASSIFLVARPRETSAVGDWAHDVRPELERIVRDRVEVLANLGVTGTDLVIAAIGAGMRAYTRYARVEKPNGEELEPGEYLDEVQREVVETVLARIFATDRGGLGRVDQATQLYVIGRFEFGGSEVPWDELNTLARGTGVELATQTSGTAPMVDKTGSKARLLDYTERGEAIELGATTVDHLHRILWLADNAPDRLKEYVDAARPDADRLRLVAHALSRPGLDSSATRGAEADACERLLGSFKRLIEDNLFTMNV